MNKILRYAVPAIIAISAGAAEARTPLESSSLSQTSMISPYYFGPNAFAIPDMVDCTRSTLDVEACGNYYNGQRGDTTWDFTIKAVVPLWTHRANLSLWLPVMEWYRNSTRNMLACNIPDEKHKQAKRGHLTGDAYVSIDLLLLEERRTRPDITLRAALKTASGGGYTIARYYDSPGYFFDVAAAKSFSISSTTGLSLRAALQTGFLCWQTDNGRQNDAIMFGARIGLHHPKFSLTETFGGYAGWESITCDEPHLAHDVPMSLKTRLSVSVSKHISIVAQYQQGIGIGDYPYNQFGLGAIWHCDILRR